MTDKEKYEARQPVVIPPAETNLLELVIQKGADLQTIERFMDLQDRHEKNEARKAYVVAMTEFKKNPPEIIKDMKVEYQNRDETTTSYSHASLPNVTAVIGTELSKYGLSGRWGVEQGDFGIKVTFILTHIAGHSESVSMIAPADSSGKKNPIQAIASTVSYLERYTMLAGTGLAAKGMDDDGNASGKEDPKYTTEEQKKEIDELFTALGITDEKDIKKRLSDRFQGLTNLDEVYTGEADILIRSLEKMIERKGENGNNN